jgi:hypothetical protein
MFWQVSETGVALSERGLTDTSKGDSEKAETGEIEFIVRYFVILLLILVGCSTATYQRFLPEVEVISEVEDDQYHVWHQKFILRSGLDSSFREAKTLDMTGAYQNLKDPAVLRKLWADYGDTENCGDSESVVDGEE